MRVIDARDASVTFKGVAEVWKGVRTELEYAKIMGGKAGNAIKLLPA